MMNGVRMLCAVVFVVAGVGLVISKTANGREYWNSPDPGFELIDLAFYGGQTGMNSGYTLYADGRLVSRRVSHTGDVVATTEYHLDAETVDGLVQTMVTAGLYESSQARLEEKMGPRRKAIVASDSPEMHLTIALDRYQASGEEKARAVKTSFVAMDPIVSARYFQSVEEVQCFKAITHFFRDYPVTREK